MSMPDVAKFHYAVVTAKHAHYKQKRKYTGEPYLVHPMAVAGLVATVTDDVDVLSAAVLHDVLEDTDFGESLIKSLFGSRVLRLVEDVTDVATGPRSRTRAERVATNIDHLRKAHPDAKTIKLADIIDNIKTVSVLDPSFAKTYLLEKAQLLPHLEDGSPALFELASKLLSRLLDEVRSSNASK